MNFRDKIEQARVNQGSNLPVKPANDNQEEYFDYDFFGITSGRTYPTSIVFRLKDGTKKAIPYSYILEIDDLLDCIEVTCTTKKVRIIGRNLQKLYDYIVAFRVRFVQPLAGTDIVEDGELAVTDIVIE